MTEERDVAIIDAEDRPGYLAELLRKVAQNELNLGPTYSITGDRIAMTANDFDKLRDVVRQAVPTTTRR